MTDHGDAESRRISMGRNTSARDIRYTTQVTQDYLEGGTLLVNMMTPAQLNETVLFDKRTYILDVRPPNDRKKQKGLPRSHEVSPLLVQNYLGQLPRAKQILVVCPGGGLSLMVSYYLKTKAFKHVTNMLGGL